jgi:hypothetical protein
VPGSAAERARQLDGEPSRDVTLDRACRTRSRREGRRWAMTSEWLQGPERGGRHAPASTAASRPARPRTSPFRWRHRRAPTSP